MAQSSSSINLQALDAELASTNADYEKLYQEMLKAKESSSVDDVDILWRLAKVTYLVSLNLLDQNAIKEKAQEVLIYAENALVLEESNFQANLWLAMALYKLARMEEDLQLKLESFAAFLKHLAICANQNEQDHLVLFMEGSLHLALLLLSTEEKAFIEQHLNSHNLPVFDFATAETKLCQSLLLNPNLLDSYITLAYLLVATCECKFDEAVELIDIALTVPRVTMSDEKLAMDMEELKALLRPN